MPQAMGIDSRSAVGFLFLDAYILEKIYEVDGKYDLRMTGLGKIEPQWEMTFQGRVPQASLIKAVAQVSYR